MRTNAERTHERTVTNVDACIATATARDDPSRDRSRSVIMRVLRRLWKRRVTGTPDRYEAYVSFPTEPGGPSIAAIHDRIADLERVFEGRLDVYSRLKRVSVVTDPVPAAGFDASAFETALERIEGAYGERTLARVEKWRSVDDRLVKSVVAVPVKPLFPRDESVDRRELQPRAD